MKNTLRFTFLLAATLLAASWLRADGVVRPSLWYVDFENADYKSKTAGSLAAGWSFGAAREHEIQLEFGRVGLSLRRPAFSVPSGFIGLVGSGSIQPLLAGYRFSISRADGFGVFVGASGGVADVSCDIAYLGSGVMWRASEDRWRATWSGTVGVSYVLDRQWSVELGYRYLHVDGLEFRTLYDISPASTVFTGWVYTLPATKAHIATLSASFRF